MRFQTSRIRQVGHAESYFFLELGKHTVTGEGELCMLADDTNAAENIHAIVLDAMKSRKNEDGTNSTRSGSLSQEGRSKHRRRTTTNTSAITDRVEQQQIENHTRDRAVSVGQRPMNTAPFPSNPSSSTIVAVPIAQPTYAVTYAIHSGNATASNGLSEPPRSASASRPTDDPISIEDSIYVLTAPGTYVFSYSWHLFVITVQAAFASQFPFATLPRLMSHEIQWFFYVYLLV